MNGYTHTNIFCESIHTHAYIYIYINREIYRTYIERGKLKESMCGAVDPMKRERGLKHCFLVQGQNTLKEEPEKKFPHTCLALM